MNGRIRSPKNLIKLAILAWIGVLGIIGVGLASRWFGDITQSEQTNEIFNAAATPPPELLDSVVWQPDRTDLARPMEPLTRIDVTSSWVRAWEQLSIVAQTGDTTGLEVYFANSALEALLASQEDTAGRPAHQLGHTLRVDFYSYDGQVLGITASDVLAVRSAQIGDTLGWLISDESYQAVLILEDGNWRIQHWVRRSVEHRWWTEPAPESLRPFIVEPDTNTTDTDEADDREGAGEAEPAATLDAVNGINYYPRDTPFADFWPNYDPDVVDSDLDLIAEAGVDSVRIFLPFDGLGGRWAAEDDLAPVVDFLDRADERDLDVHVTLFDGRTDHRTDKWNSDTAHLETVVTTLMDHPALAMWDLKNEPDRDIGANGVDEQLMYAWIGHVAHELRKIDPNTPTTVGWSTPEAALAAPIHTDVLSFHFYGPPEQLEERAPELMAHADGRPVVLSEYGLPTWDGLFPGGHTEEHQARYLADVRSISREAGLAGTMVWTLWDLTSAPPDAGFLPWKSGPQKHLGLLRTDGSPKPALAVVHPTADLDAVPTINGFDRINLLFWRVAFAFLVAGVVGKVGLGQTRRRLRYRRATPQLDDADAG